MSLVGFKARNHPQQTRKRGPRPEVDDRATPPEFFRPLDERFGFTLDVAALPHNAKCERFFTPDDDGLAQPWRHERVWCNPPFSNLEPWVAKAAAEWDRNWDYGYIGGGADLIVMIVPVRTEQGWWHRHVEPARLKGTLRVEFLQGRTRFIAHDDTEIRPNSRPPYACCLLIWSHPSMPNPASGEER